ncbi:hypothetical protein GCM10018965_051560 [Nonomuraea roseola]
MTAEGVPAHIVELRGYPFTTVMDGRSAHLGDGVHAHWAAPPRLRRLRPRERRHRHLEPQGQRVKLLQTAIPVTASFGSNLAMLS